MSNVTSLQYSEFPTDPPAYEEDMLPYNLLHYKNYTEKFIPVENEIPLFDESCEPIKVWQRIHYPNCLTFHSLDYTELKLLGIGNARIVWKLGEEAALKITRKNHFNSNRTLYESWRIDAMISERLTSSPHVLDIYGHCGLATLNQVGTVIPHWSRNTSQPLVKKLSLALQLSMAVADVHSIDGDNVVTAVWRNIKPENVLFIGERLTITDFDESILPWWSPAEKKPCKFHTIYSKPKLFQPLELSIPGKDSDEKIDIYALGVMIYTILTGSLPFKQTNHFQFKERGMVPVHRKKQMMKDSISKTLWKVALQCMAQNPNERPSARHVVKALEKALSQK